MARFSNSKGSALPLVLFFCVCAFISASTYLLTHLSIRRLSSRRPWQVQALLNARSGIWYGLKNMTGSSNQDSVIQDGLDTLFANDLFDDTIYSDGIELSGLSDEGTVLVPYSDSSFGSCSLIVSTDGAYLALTSVGTYKSKLAAVTASLGSRPFSSPDTVLFLKTQGMPEGQGRVDGQIHFIKMAVDSAHGKRGDAFGVNAQRKQRYLAEARSLLDETSDTGAVDASEEIRDTEAFYELPDIVLGALILNSTFGKLRVEKEREIAILGDLQIIGDPDLSNVSFVVEGDIKVFDHARLRNVNLFSTAKIFLAGQVSFLGSAAAMGEIEIYESAEVEPRSTIICFGESKSQGSKSLFSTHIRDNAKIDGVVVDLSKQRGIETLPGVEVTGVLWAEGNVCHEGQLSGVVRARRLVGRVEEEGKNKNTLDGMIRSLEDIATYVMPYFIGVPKVVAWREMAWSDAL